MYLKLFLSITAAAVMILSVEITKRGKYRKTVFLIISLFYFFALFYFVGFSGKRNNLSGVSFLFPLPFWRAIKAKHYGLSTNRSVLNMILFIPFGYLLPQIINWKAEWRAKWWMIIIAGFIFSLIIETSQLVFKFGVFEMDDLVKNTMGAAIGCLLYKGLKN